MIKRTGVAHFEARDLRRTCATGLGKIGVPDATISRVLNHKIAHGGSARITLAYNKYNHDSEKREAFAKWDEYVIRLLRPQFAEKVA